MGILICGLTFALGGGAAVVEGTRVLFSVEVEKLGNREQYSRLDGSRDIEAIPSGPSGRRGLSPGAAIMTISGAPLRASAETESPLNGAEEGSVAP